MTSCLRRLQRRLLPRRNTTLLQTRKSKRSTPFGPALKLDTNFASMRGKSIIGWDMFNVTNSVRFDPQSITSALDNPQSFGQATAPS
jgi:hypothetical protein